MPASKTSRGHNPYPARIRIWRTSREMKIVIEGSVLILILGLLSLGHILYLLQ